MGYSGNYDADRYYDQHVNGRKCLTCDGTGEITIKNWKDFKNFLRQYKLDFKALLSYAREFRNSGKIECPSCYGEGKKY